MSQLPKTTPVCSGTTQGSKQTGNWTDVSNWLSVTLPTLADNVTINTGQILTIPSGEKVYAGTLNDKGTLRNFGTLNMGKATTTDLYTQSYKYHIRGGLKSINTDANNDLTNSLFSYKLTYEDGGFYDGNIGNQFWKSNIDGKQRAYAYQYDGDSRLKSATYASTQTGENYALNNVDYDGNGNILSLSRNGATNNNFTSFGNVDNLTYTYQSNSNKLLKVADATTTNTDLGDFRDGTNTGDDYEYWADGSLKRDRNKKIASITYNYLKRPEIITFDNGRTITTEYDAEGTKLKKIDSNGEVTDYEEDDIYVNGNLYQTSHDEGRIANGIYEYNITDHNNDLRVAFKDSSGVAVPVQSIFYDPWGLSMKGMQITRNPTNFNKYQFLNRETQFETGYIDLINRQFDPQTGRFTSQDPVTGGQEHLSLYQYGWNNPVLKSDANGLFPGEGLWNGIKNWWNSTASKSRQEIGAMHNKNATGTTIPVKTNGDYVVAALSSSVKVMAEERMGGLGLTRGVLRSGRSRTPKPNVESEATPQVNLQARANDIQNSQPNLKARNLSTTSVAEVNNADGSTQIVVSSSRQRLTPAQRNALQEGEVEIKGKGHAEATIINYAESNGASVLRIAASRAVCEGCQAVIGTTNAVIESPVKPIKIPFKVE